MQAPRGLGIQQQELGILLHRHHIGVGFHTLAPVLQELAHLAGLHIAVHRTLVVVLAEVDIRHTREFELELVGIGRPLEAVHQG